MAILVETKSIESTVKGECKMSKCDKCEDKQTCKVYNMKNGYSACPKDTVGNIKVKEGVKNN